MKCIEIYNEEQFRSVFDSNSENKVAKGDVLIVKEVISLSQDIIIDVPVTIQLEANKIILNDHLIMKEQLLICLEGDGFGS